MNNSVYAVILAGGKGARLWPLSTEGFSKPFIKFAGEKTLIENAIERIRHIVERKNIYVVVDRTKSNILRKTNIISKDNIIVEPFGRNTASAAGLAAINLKAEDNIIVFPSDQTISKSFDNFKKSVKDGLNFIKHNKNALICIGTVPEFPSTSFGYIRIRKNIKGNIAPVDRFIEKPDLNVARKFCRNRRYLWNAGIFVFRVESLLKAIKKHAPGLYKKLQLIKRDKKKIKSAYARMKNISLDYTIMEKAKNLYCVRGGFGWQDIGNWVSVGKLSKKDKKGNVCVGKNCLINVSDSIIYNTGKRTVGAVGLRNMVVVHTENGTLVCSKKDAERVKELIEKIR